ALADPGGLCISESVYQHVEGKLELAFDDLGAYEVKNIAKPVRMFRVLPRGSTAPTRAATSEGPTKPSIAVLPFTNMSNDPEQEVAAGALPGALIPALPGTAALFVIARHSTFAYKGKAVDVRRIARDLGVRYLVEGSARLAAGRVRISVQLIDALGGDHLWV